MQYPSHIPKNKTRRSSWALQEPSICKIWILDANPNNNGQGSHWWVLPYDNNGWTCELDETNICIVNFLSTFEGPFWALTFISKFLKTFLNVHTRENDTSPLCISCTLIPQIISFLHSHLFVCCMRSPSPRLVYKSDHHGNWCEASYKLYLNYVGITQCKVFPFPR